MKNKSSYSLGRPRRATRSRTALWLIAAAVCLLLPTAPRAGANGDAPAWMHGLVNAPLPAHDEKTDAVVLYAEKIVTVQSADKIRTQVRLAYKILRPGGRDLGTVVIPFDSQSKINWLRAWCIPSQGKDYEVKDKEAAEVALPSVQGSELITDVRAKVLHIPAP